MWYSAQYLLLGFEKKDDWNNIDDNYQIYSALHKTTLHEHLLKSVEIAKITRNEKKRYDRNSIIYTWKTIDQMADL